LRLIPITRYQILREIAEDECYAELNRLHLSVVGAFLDKLEDKGVIARLDHRGHLRIGPFKLLTADDIARIRRHTEFLAIHVRARTTIGHYWPPGCAPRSCPLEEEMEFAVTAAE